MIQQQSQPTLEALDGGKVTAEYAGKPLQLSTSGIQSLWANGLINEEAFITLALMVDAPSLEPNSIFDCYEFQDNWSTVIEDKNGKEKEKTPKITTIRKVLDKLQEQALADVRTTTQLTLSFDKL